MEFLDALFHGVDVESILDEEEVWSRQTRVKVRKDHNFRSDCWIAIKLLMEFSDSLSMEWIWNRYSVRRRSGHGRLE
jgi:hypothetical protein